MALWKRRNPVVADNRTSAGGDAPPSLEELGLAHLTFDQRVGLRDEVLAGFYLNDSGELVSGFPITGSDILVDVGCGSGGPLEFCARHAGHVHAIDVDQRVIDHARAQMTGRGIDLSNVTFHVGSGAGLPLPDGSATRVICLEVLEHVDDPSEVMAELVRVAAPGALLLVSVPDSRGEEFLRHYAPAAAWEPPHHIRTFDRGQLRKVVLDAGLEILDSGTTGFFRAIWLGLYWSQDQKVGDESHEAIPIWATDDNDILHEWTDVWNSILDRPNGQKLKLALDGLLPKSQYLVTRKP